MPTRPRIVYLVVQGLGRERPEGDAEGPEGLGGEGLVGAPDLIAAPVAEGACPVAGDLVRAARQ
jgi:hypothetical protein